MKQKTAASMRLLFYIFYIFLLFFNFRSFAFVVQWPFLKICKCSIWNMLKAPKCWSLVLLSPESIFLNFICNLVSKVWWDLATSSLFCCKLITICSWFCWMNEKCSTFIFESLYFLWFAFLFLFFCILNSQIPVKELLTINTTVNGHFMIYKLIN